MRRDAYRNFKEQVDGHAHKVKNQIEENVKIWESMKVCIGRKDFESLETNELMSAQKFGECLEELSYIQPDGMLLTYTLKIIKINIL